MVSDVKVSVKGSFELIYLSLDMLYDSTAQLLVLDENINICAGVGCRLIENSSSPSQAFCDAYQIKSRVRCSISISEFDNL